MKKAILVALPIIAIATLIGFMTMSGCDDEDCIESGDQCSRSSECCDGACNPAEYAGVYRCN